MTYLCIAISPVCIDRDVLMLRGALLGLSLKPLLRSFHLAALEMKATVRSNLLCPVEYDRHFTKTLILAP